MQLPTYVSRNGVLVEPDQARVSVFDPALYGAYGVYESLQVVQGVAFELAAHLQRLARSATILELPLPGDPPTFERWIVDVLRANRARDCTLRLFAMGGSNGDGVTCFIWPQPAPVYPQEFYTQGASAILFEGQRTFPEAKSLNALVSYLARRRAGALGIHEGLLHNGGYLTEGSNSNLFAVIDGEVLTPPATQVLSGVTRDVLFELGERNGTPIREAELAVSHVPMWQECFITSTSRHVMPITTIGDQHIADGGVGPLTRRFAGWFEGYFRLAIANGPEVVP